MRIATWNIGGCFIFNKNKSIYDLENIHYFINELNKIQPDIICLQESHVSEEIDQAENIAKGIGFKYFESQRIANSHLKKNEGLSLSIISKFPITFKQYYKLVNPNLKFFWRGNYEKSHDKGFLEANILYNNYSLRVMNGHMIPFRKFDKRFDDDEFKEMREQIVNIILQDNKPQIICADMNYDNNIKYILSNVIEKGFKSIIEDHSTTAKGRKYDKILISPEWIFTNSKIAKGKADHYLCYADIELIGNIT